MIRWASTSLSMIALQYSLKKPSDAEPLSLYLMSVVKLRHARDQADNPRNGLAGQYGRYEEVTG